MAAPQPRLAVLTAAIFLSIPLAQAQPAAGRATTGTPSKAPVVLILLENHAYGQIVGSRGAPYLNSRFIPAGTLFTRYFAVAHPSLPKSTDFDRDEPDGWSPAPTTPPAGEAVELLLKRDVSAPSYYCGYFNGSAGESEAFTCCGIFTGTRAPVGEVIRECYG